MTDDEVYLRHVLETLTRIEGYTAKGREGLMRNGVAQDATVRNLEIAGEATKRLSPELRSSQPEDHHTESTMHEKMGKIGHLADVGSRIVPVIYAP